MSLRSMYAKKVETVAALPSIPKELIDQFVSGQMSAEAVNAASMAFKKALIERALGAELSHHLGYPPVTVDKSIHASHTEILTLWTCANIIRC